MKFRFALRGSLKITISFALAIFLSLINYTGWLKYAAPQWVILVLFYWCMVEPRRVSVGRVWCLGLLLDLLQGTLFGLQAFSKSIIAWLVVHNNLRVRLYPHWQQCVAVWVLCCLDFSVYAVAYYITQGISFRFEFLLASFTTALLWLPVLMLFRRFAK